VSRAATITSLLFILALAAGARAMRLEHVFLDDGSVVFAVGDAFYHMHRALFSFHHFPDFLRFDPCINWPEGAPVPHAPLYDLALAGLARMFSNSISGFERTAAWLPVALGALTTLPVYALGSSLGGRAVGLGAACLYAVLPIAIAYSSVGNPDHHAAVGLEGALLLALYSAALAPRLSRRRLAWIALGLTLARTALLGTWHGSLLYFPIGEGALLLFGVLRGHRELLLAQAASLLASGLLIAPVVAATATPVAGPWSATELSLLHLLLLGAGAVLAAAAALAEQASPLSSAPQRLRHLGLVGLVIGGAMGCAALLLPGFWDGVVPAFEFLTKRDDWGNNVLEQLSIFHQQGEVRLSAAVRHLGYYSYLLPLAPASFWLLADRPALRDRALFLLAWTLVFAALAVFQVRFANDFAAAFCVAFALLLGQAAAELRRRTRLSSAAAAGAATALGVALWSPTLVSYFEPAWRAGSDASQPGHSKADRALSTVEGAQVRFAELVRAATPETPGCDGTADVPHYGVLAAPALGHVLHKVAQRATPADPFGPYIGEPAYREVVSFMLSQSEPEAVATTQRLRTPFVALAEGPEDQPLARISRRLMERDGSEEDGLAHLEHFRLATEGPQGGIPFRIAFESEVLTGIPYKLFEVVSGAVLEAEATPQQRVKAQLVVETPAGRRFHFLASARADEAGVARLRVPYWTDGDEPVRAVGPYRLVAREKRWIATVSEADVREGRVVRAAPRPPKAGASASDAETR